MTLLWHLKNMGLGIVDVNIMERMPMQGDGWIYLILATKGVQKKKIQNYSINVCIPLPFRDIFFIIDGKAYMCYVNHRLLDDINEREDEHVDFCDENLQLSDIKEKLYALRDRNHLSVCARCNGFCTDGKRYTPAEQLQ